MKPKYLTLIIPLILSGCSFLPQKAKEPPETAAKLPQVSEPASQNLFLEGLPEIEADLGEFAPENQLSTFISSLEEQPEYLLNKCPKIYLLSREKMLREFGDKDEAVLAFSTQNGMYVTPENSRDTITHELWHQYDLYYGKMFGTLYGFSEDEDFLDMYSRNMEFFGAYARSSPQEFFAEAGKEYINHPSMLMVKCEEVYEYFDGLPKE